MLSGKFAGHVFGVFRTRVGSGAQAQNLALVALNERLKRQFIATLCGSESSSSAAASQEEQPVVCQSRFPK